MFESAQQITQKYVVDKRRVCSYTVCGFSTFCRLFLLQSHNTKQLSTGFSNDGVTTRMPASTASLRQREGENSTSLMLFLLSLDFGSVFGREDDVGRVHGLLPIHNLDLDRGTPACFCWCALAKAARPSVTISFSSNFRGAFLFIPLK